MEPFIVKHSLFLKIINLLNIFFKYVMFHIIHNFSDFDNQIITNKKLMFQCYSY